MSGARHGALPKPLARLHPVRNTPTFATIFVGAAAATMLGLLTTVSPDFIGDALLSIGLMICAYYSATGLACVWYFRHEFRTSARSLIMRGILPLIGAAMMLTALVFSAKDMLAPGYGSTSLFGIGGVFLLGVGLISLGLVVAAILRVSHKTFFTTGHRTIADTLIEES
jgi:amino acid transporter